MGRIGSIATVLLGTLALAAGCGVNKEVHQKALDKISKLQKDNEGLNKRAEKAEEQLSVAKAQLEALGQDLSKLNEAKQMTGAELELARKRMAELHRRQQANEQRISQFRKLASRFKKMMSDGKLEIQVRNGRMLVKLADEILFPPGRDKIKRAGRDALIQVAQILRTVANRDFQIAGHTDNIPIRSRKFRSNWELSMSRALKVLHILVEAGMEPKRLSAAGFADQAPVADNSTEDGRRLNRRIEIVLEPNIEELPNLENILGTPAGRTGPAIDNTPAG